MMLPSRPYTISASYARRRVLSAIAALAVGVCSFVGGAWFFSYQSRSIHRDEALWARGVLADDSHVSGRETSHSAIINSYELDTQYADATGARHSGRVSFDLLFSSISDGTPVSLKYDPQHPELHTVSWAVERAGARWGFAAFMTIALGGLFGAGLVALAVRNLRTLADARRVAERSDEVALEIVSVKPIHAGRRHVGDVYTFFHTVGDQRRQLKQQLAPKEAPMFTDEQRTHLVALVSPRSPARPWIMRADRAPFV